MSNDPSRKKPVDLTLDDIRELQEDYRSTAVYVVFRRQDTFNHPLGPMRWWKVYLFGFIMGWLAKLAGELVYEWMKAP